MCCSKAYYIQKSLEQFKSDYTAFHYLTEDQVRNCLLLMWDIRYHEKIHVWNHGENYGRCRPWIIKDLMEDWPCFWIGIFLY